MTRCIFFRRTMVTDRVLDDATHLSNNDGVDKGQLLSP